MSLTPDLSFSFNFSQTVYLYIDIELFLALLPRFIPIRNSMKKLNRAPLKWFEYKLIFVIRAIRLGG